MEKTKKISIHDLDVEWLTWLLQRWDLEEFIDLAREKNINGKKLLDISEGLVKLWRPRSNAKKFMVFVEDLKRNPNKYLLEIYDIVNNNEKKENKNEEESQKNGKCMKETGSKNVAEQPEINCKIIEDVKYIATPNAEVADQYQIISIKKKEESIFSMTSDELMKEIVKPKSFLYKHHKPLEKLPSYLPMNSGMPKKSKQYSYYSQVDATNQLLRKERSNDKSYCPMKRRSDLYNGLNKSRYKWFQRTEETPLKYPDDHFYEDLYFKEDKHAKIKQISHKRFSASCIGKIQELFQNLKASPILKKTMITGKTKQEKYDKEAEYNEANYNLYETSESGGVMYDSIQNDIELSANNTKYHQLPVEDYLVPTELNKDYCDVKNLRQDESIRRYILNLFSSRFWFNREPHDDQSDLESKKRSTAAEDGGSEVKVVSANMAERPLPVPVESEPYYLNLSREQAQDLLQGQPDGTYVIRPSSQSGHVYSLSIACGQTVHNVGIRRRADGKLALGYPRHDEARFWSIASLVEYHKQRRLMLVIDGKVIGGTTLTEPPVYYQTPKNIPLHLELKQ